MLTPTTAILLGAVALIVLGPKQLPEFGKSLGKFMGEFRKGLNADPDAMTPAQTAQAVPVAPAIAAPASAPVNVAADPVVQQAPAHVEPSPPQA